MLAFLDQTTPFHPNKLAKNRQKSIEFSFNLVENINFKYK